MVCVLDIRHDKHFEKELLQAGKQDNVYIRRELLVIMSVIRIAMMTYMRTHANRLEKA